MLAIRSISAVLLGCTWLLLVVPTTYASPTLKFRIEGISGSLEDNVRAYLGELPEDEDERANFVFSAQRHVEQALQAMGYYTPDINIRVNQEEAVWRMEVDVAAGEPVRVTKMDVRILGEASADSAFERLLAESELALGDRLNHEHYEALKTSIQSLGQRRGYLQARTTKQRVAVDIVALSAVVELHYDSGPRYRFGEVSFDDFPLNANQFQHMQGFRTGDPVDLDALRAFQSELQRTGYFGNSLVRPEPPDHERLTMPVKVELSPNVRHRFQVGVGYSTDMRERLSLGWSTPLINRYGHRQETRYEYSPVRPRGSINYTIPLSHPNNDRLVLRARLERNEYGDLESDQKGAGVLREQQHEKWLTTMSLRYLQEDWDVGLDRRQNTYVLPGVALSHRFSEGNALDPPSGFSQFYTGEIGSGEAGSDLDLLRLYGSWRFVFTPWEKHRVATRLELGAVTFSSRDRPDLAPSLSFFAGGNQSIRGYGYQSLGPEVEVPVGPGDETVSLVVGGDRLVVGSIEYQYYLRPEWRLGVFTDAGNAFNGSDFDPVLGAGIGVHYISPVGPVRLDLANAVSEGDGWRIHFTIGAEL